MTRIHHHNKAAQLAARLQVAGKQFLPVSFHCSRHLRVPVPGQVHQKAPRPQAEKIDLLRSARGLADEGQAVAPGKRVECARFARVRASHKRHFDSK
jgi:hypothetical protein